MPNFNNWANFGQYLLYSPILNEIRRDKCILSHIYTIGRIKTLEIVGIREF
jgi:hypothetical protein